MITKTTDWDPTVCEHCRGPMSEPALVGQRWMNHCLNCGRYREVNTDSPLLQQQINTQRFAPYPELLREVGPERPWIPRENFASTGDYVNGWDKGIIVTADYYHMAPTTERARIQQHGLQPSNPALNERWWSPGYDHETGEELFSEPPRWLQQQPVGVYVEPTPDRARKTWGVYLREEDGFHTPEAWDTWRIPNDQIHEHHVDTMSSGFSIPHVVYPELQEGGPEKFGPWPERKTALQTPVGFGMMYHVSPRSKREQILREGLQGHRRNYTGSPWENEPRWGVQPEGNYLFADPIQAQMYAHNLHGRHPSGKSYQDDAWESPETPEGFDDWDEDRQDEWYDDHPGEFTNDDPHGYDMWRVQTAGLPISPDPESSLIADPNEKWDIGRIHDIENGEEYNPWGQTSPELTDHGAEPLRYYVPKEVTPDRLQLHQHLPMWDTSNEEAMAEQDLFSAEPEIPTAWMQTPKTEIPWPGHE